MSENDMDCGPTDTRTTHYYGDDCVPPHVCGACSGRGFIAERRGSMSGEFTCLACGGNPSTPENVEAP